ncbi:hypothetical protein [Actinoalloteichus spitiensis]|uniref:hypothetical protein n=1 Tax=Actinoalloteichus spitiensis TaxID=252394 RepID=UPI0012F67F8D|nr:hypothetical protein [Actinoalloteichus spitiensis]
MSAADENSYQPRPIRFLGIEAVAGWRIKCYGISDRARQPDGEVIDAAVTQAVSVVSATGTDSGVHGVGFVVAHETAEHCLTQVHWWERSATLVQRRFSSTRDSAHTFREVRSQTMGSVWDLAVVSYERGAWVRHVLANSTGPDLAAYLDDGFSGLV